MRFIDICAGIGGFRLGLERAGHKCIGFVEKDKFAVKSYKAMYDTEREWYRDDITKIRANDIPDADCWCFGFPCQDISIAGKQQGLDGKRSGIYFDIIKLLKGKKEEDRPEWLLIENVKRLLSIDSGWGFSRVLSELDKAGYDAEWQVLNSKDFGVPQNRERIYIVGHLGSRGTRKILPVTGENTKDGISVVEKLNPKRHRDCKEPKLMLIGRINGKNTQRGRVYSKYGISPTLHTCAGGNIEAKVLISEGVARKLTPKEYWRLQGFLDDLFEKAAAVNSDTQLYKQAGNAATVNVVYAIGMKIKEVEE